jgi:uncharacterized BrkB/YihY/UPF0761 family membrane protein
VLELQLDRFFCLFAARTATVTMLRRLFAVQNSSSLVAKRLLSAGSGMQFLSFVLLTVSMYLFSIIFSVTIIVMHGVVYIFFVLRGTPGALIFYFWCCFTVLEK